MENEIKRRWNLLPTAGFLLNLLAFLSYYAFFARFPATRDFPWVNLGLFAVGFALLGIGLKRAFGQPERYSGKIQGPILATLSLLILGFFGFYNFWFSRQLPASAAAPRVGEKAPDFSLPDTSGNPVTLSNLFSDGRSRWVLLTFYRGYW